MNKIQFFVGTVLALKQFPAPAGSPQTVINARRTNMIFGLNVPVRQVLQTLKAAK